MSIKDKQKIEELERKLAYYKEMYEMRSSALIKAIDGWDNSRDINRRLLNYIDKQGWRQLSTHTTETKVKR